MTTTHHEKRPASTRETDWWIRRAWIAVALIPVFFFIAFAVGEGLYAALGYKPENSDAPVWVELLCLVAVLAVFLVPCAVAVYYGRRAVSAGERRGVSPFAIGALAGLAVTVLGVVSTVAGIMA